MGSDSEDDVSSVASSRKDKRAKVGEKKSFLEMFQAVKNFFYAPSELSRRKTLAKRHYRAIRDFGIVYRRKCRDIGCSPGQPVKHWLKMCHDGFSEFKKGDARGLGAMSVEALIAFVKTVDDQPDSIYMIKTVDLTGAVRSGQAAEAVRELLKEMKMVSELRLDNNLLFGDKAVTTGVTVLEGLKENSSLRRLSVRRVYTPDPAYLEFFTKLSDIVANHPKLEALEVSLLPNFGESKIGIESAGTPHKGIAYLLDSQRRDSAKLRVLHLNYCDLTDSVAGTLKEIVKNNVKLKEIDLSNNQLGSRSFLMIAEALKGNQFIETLKLYHNRGLDSGVEQVLNAAVGNVTLKHLDVGLNDGKDLSVKALCNLITSNNLFTIGYSYNMIGLHGPLVAKALLDRFNEENMSLTTLLLAGTRVRMNFVKPFIELLKDEDCPLKELDLSQNQFDRKTAQMLARACMTNESLEKCDIGVENYALSAGPAVTQEMRQRAKLNTEWVESDTDGSISPGLESSGIEDEGGDDGDSDDSSDEEKAKKKKNKKNKNKKQSANETPEPAGTSNENGTLGDFGAGAGGDNDAVEEL